MESISERIIPVFRPYGRRLQRRLDSWLADLVERESPGLLERTAASALARARAGLLYNLEGRWGSLQTWQGAEITSGSPLRIAFLGDRQAYKVSSPEYLRYILFQPEGISTGEGASFPMRRARSLAEALPGSPDLLVVEANDLLRWQPSGGLWMWLPTWVRMVISLPPERSWDDIRAAMRSQRDNIRKAQSGGFSLVTSHRDADFEFFYERMHLPMMRERHGDYGIVDKKETLYEQFRQGLLALVHLEGRPVAGALLYLRGRSAYGIANGVLDGRSLWNQRGAVAYLYLATIRWCHENSYHRYDLGGVRPFANDGLYRFKQRWGAHPEPDLWLGRSWLFWLPHTGPGQSSPGLDWLRAHPAAPVPGLLRSPGFPEKDA